MKTSILTFLFNLFLMGIIAQNNVGINNPAPDPSATLDITATSMGLLPPRVADTNAISSPAEGLMVYDLDSHCMRYYNGSSWSECMGNIVSTATWDCGENIIDSRDGRSYSTVQIGTQCWMAENLNIGTMVDPGTGQTDNSVTEKFCYENDPSNCDTYGGLYQWGEIMEYVTTEGAKGICPDGWHIPTDAEFCTLENEVDAGIISCSRNGWEGSDAGGNLKITGTSHWLSPNTGATNSSGFAALGAGYYLVSNGFIDQTIVGYFQSSSETGGIYSVSRLLGGNHADISRLSTFKTSAQSVRCIKD